MNRLEEKYRNEAVPSLMSKHNYSTVMLVPKIEKIVVNMGVGDAVANSKMLEAAVSDLEKITPAQALKHPKKHVLTNALGIKKNVSVDIGQIKLKDDENLLICSDGVYNLLDRKKMMKLLNEEIDIELMITKRS